MLLWVGLINAADPEQSLLERSVTEVFVRDGPIQSRVPEFVAQLRVSAAIEIGKIRMPAPEGRWRCTKEYPYYEPDGMPREQMVCAFEFERGSVRQALDAYCRLNPGLSWKQNGAVIAICRTSDAHGAVNAWLDPVMEAYSTTGGPYYEGKEKMPLHVVLVDVTLAVKKSHGALGGGETKAGFYIGLADRDDPFPLHVTPPDRAPIVFAGGTVRELLFELLRPLDGHLWTAYSLDDNPTAWVNVVNWSQVRRKLTLAELADAITAKPGPLYDYRDLDSRMDGAFRELRRRYHFYPEAVRESVLGDGRLGALVSAGEKHQSVVAMRRIFSLGDDLLTQHLATAATSVSDRDRRFALVYGFLRPYNKGFEIFMPYLRRLTEDDDSRVRREAQMRLEWHAKRLERYAGQKPPYYEPDEM